MSRALLVLNAGSSSLKFAVFGQAAGLPLLLRGSISQLGHAPRLKIRCPGAADSETALGAAPMPPDAAVRTVFDELGKRDLLERIGAVGHRIVHGGLTFAQPSVLDSPTLARLRQLAPLAPLHQPYNLDIVELASGLLPAAIQIGAFDTAFHAGRPRQDRLYGLPRRLSDDGIIAYGFHGLSYAHVATVLRARDGARAGGRTIVAHLGSGASLCAMDAGRSVATTMGFSALDGLIMSSRCGSLDPGIILHLIRERQMSADAVSELLYERSGLLGVSELSGDMQTLLQSADPHASEAVELFVYRIGRQIGSLAAALGGLDTLVFTAGIGENAPIIRQRIGAAAAWLGVDIDPARNGQGETSIGSAASAVEVLVIAADEERAVAEGVMACLG
ncbi:acetate/propionate family kinase [Pseudoxanthomonas wuyuanensis]|uniref:Acetate kinase n=1 Tax=Pseudoxanthomonas wuyuanensis TaxID=1073196 RepID=A0A286CZD1_9GAMM|nr:acetate/propionate family kinase [Pseudoxanthomonas wuyuanensis]KAF1722336.1 acetate/propionate family kinase [Pseudoxanthomonas wuyuanensis]SOD51765.1 acetate kinase [Pseudoxanthomonas wuyuanensis]